MNATWIATGTANTNGDAQARRNANRNANGSATTSANTSATASVIEQECNYEYTHLAIGPKSPTPDLFGYQPASGNSLLL